jgi:hypothetical protein
VRQIDYEPEEVMTVRTSKMPRSKPLVAANPRTDVVDATRRALDATADERDRMESLLALRGVDVPSGSALLHFAEPEAYPILDGVTVQTLDKAL